MCLACQHFDFNSADWFSDNLHVISSWYLQTMGKEFIFQFSRRSWGRNAWRTPKNVCVGGYSKCKQTVYTGVQARRYPAMDKRPVQGRGETSISFVCLGLWLVCAFTYNVPTYLHIDQVWGHDDWVLAKVFFYAFLVAETKSSLIKIHKKTRPVSSHHEPNMLICKGFIIWQTSVGNPE